MHSRTDPIHESTCAALPFQLMAKVVHIVEVGECEHVIAGRFTPNDS